MPIDGGGTFTRSQNFTQDRDNGIKILASHVDDEFDNFAAAMNEVFFRSGLVAMGGDLNMGTYRIIGLHSGTAGSPSIKFNSDTSTGLFLSAAGTLGLSAGGTSRATISSASAFFDVPIARDANFGLDIPASDPRVTFDSTDYMTYIRASNKFQYLFGGTVHTEHSASGFKVGASTVGTVSLGPGDGTHAGAITFNNAAGVLQGYIGNQTTGGVMEFSNAGGYSFLGVGTVSVASHFNVGGIGTLAELVVSGNSTVDDLFGVNAQFTGKVFAAPSASGSAGLSLGVGTDPSSPSNGDIWINASNLKFRVGGTTYTVLTSAGATTLTDKLTTVTPASGQEAFIIPHGAAPAAPTNGSFWTTTGGVFVRVNGATKQMQDASTALAALGSVTPAADKIAYFNGASTAVLADLSSFARTILDDTTAAAVMGTLGITGTLAAKGHVDIPTAVGVIRINWGGFASVASNSTATEALSGPYTTLWRSFASITSTNVSIDSPAGATSTTTDITVMNADPSLAFAINYWTIGLA